MTVAAMRGNFGSTSHGCPFETSLDWQNSEVSMGTASARIGGKRAAPNNGTRPAVDRLSLGVAANCPKAEGRGGARNRADRPSQALSRSQISNLKAAERHSGAIGLPFTRMVTIHWKAAGVPLEAMVGATGAFIDKLTKWLARRGHRTAWLWVHENAGDKGWHCHILIHIPARVVSQLPAAQKRWLRQITGRAYSKRVIRSDPIGGRLGLESSNPQLHLANRQAALAYLLKGAEVSVPRTAGLDQREPQGLILGKRCSTSQNIGHKARGGGEDEQ